MAFYDVVLDPLKDTGLYPLLLFLSVLLIGLIVARVFVLFVHRAMIRHFPIEAVKPFKRVTYWGVVLIFLFGGLSIFSIDLTGVLLLGGILGIAIGFAAQSTISNLISGVFLRFDRPFKQGDSVEIAGIGGTVREITIFSTRMRTWDGVLVRIPNEQVFSATIRNLEGYPARRVDFVVGVEYGDDQDRAIELLREMLSEHPQVLVEPPSRVFVQQLGESSVDIQVRAWVPSARWIDLVLDIRNRSKHVIEENGLTIAFPQRVMWQAPAGPNTERAEPV